MGELMSQDRKLHRVQSTIFCASRVQNNVELTVRKYNVEKETEGLIILVKD